MPPTPRPPQISPITSVPLFWQLQIAGWGGFAILSLPLKQAAYGSLGPAVLLTACQLLLSLVFSTALRQLYRWTQPARRSFPLAAGLVLAACTALGALDATISLPFTPLLAGSNQSELLGTALYFFRAAVYLIWSLGYFLIKAQLQTREQAFQAAVADEKHRFELLRYQLNPDFLARSFATISREFINDPAVARAMTARLAEFYQNTLRRTDRGQPATIGDEITLLRAYLEIERLHLRGALSVRFELDDTLLPLPLPPLLLLPLAERAIKTGGTAGQPLEITITAQRTANGHILLEVANTGRLDKASAPDPTSPEATDVRVRLERYYPGRHRFALTQDSVKVRATLYLPPAG